MTAKVFVFFLLLTSAAFGGGYWVARHTTATDGLAGSAPMTSESPAAPSAANASGSNVEAAAAPVADAKGKPTLVEIEARIRELSGAGMRFDYAKRYQAWEKFVDSMDPADIAQAI